MQKKNVYELPLISVEKSAPVEIPKRVYSPLPFSLLKSYALWFCYLRWIVIAIMTVVGIIGFMPAVYSIFGFRALEGWAFIIAALLIVANLGYSKHIRLLKDSGSINSIMANLWVQITIDLVILTAVVHFVGSIETFVPFAYLFHIVLACIFFPGLQSLGVTIAASILYLSCVLAESAGIISLAGIYSDRVLRGYVEDNLAVSTINVVSVLGIWLVVWYLASHIAAMVREREKELAAANSRLKNIQKERNRHMLRTTHELKAPFAAIHANSQLLLAGYCGELPDSANEVIQRIAARCSRLTNEIQKMLQLTNLRSAVNESLQRVTFDLAEVLEWCLVQIRPVAEERKVELETHISPVNIIGIEDYLKMLLVNLLTNAVQYSHDNGHVRVECYRVDENEAVIIIEDDGLGIPEDKLPRIFDEYYRTDEAVQHNKGSSGLGLTIVKHVAQIHNIKIKVESRPDSGTKFTLRFSLYKQ